jgi:uncharacterized coiled-coil DUF342 family protein
MKNFSESSINDSNNEAMNYDATFNKATDNDVTNKCANCLSLVHEIGLLNQKLSESQEELGNLIEKIRELNTHLKKYTAPERARAYYQNHKDDLKHDPDYKQKRAEINKRAYEKRKQQKALQATTEDLKTEDQNP